MWISLVCFCCFFTVSSTLNNVRSPLLKNYESQTTLRTNVRSGEDDLDEIVSVMLTPKTGSRLQLPDVRILNAQVTNGY